jgi:hypothetical protein
LSADFDHFTCELMAKRHRILESRPHVAKVQIRAADAGGTYPDDQIVGPGDRSLRIIQPQVSGSVKNCHLHLCPPYEWWIGYPPASHAGLRMGRVNAHRDKAVLWN